MVFVCFFNIYLRFNLFFFDTVVVEPGDVQLTVKVTNITHNSILQHKFKVTTHDNVFTTTGSDKNTCPADHFINGGDLKTCRNITFVK